jgi:hypothetical protein
VHASSSCACRVRKLWCDSSTCGRGTFNALQYHLNVLRNMKTNPGKCHGGLARTCWKARLPEKVRKEPRQFCVPHKQMASLEVND